MGVVLRLVRHCLHERRAARPDRASHWTIEGHEGRLFPLPRLLLQPVPRCRPHLQHLGQRHLEHRLPLRSTDTLTGQFKTDPRYTAPPSEPNNGAALSSAKTPSTARCSSTSTPTSWSQPTSQTILNTSKHAHPKQNSSSNTHRRLQHHNPSYLASQPCVQR